MTSPRTKCTVADYMALPDGQRYELLNGELIVAPSPSRRHQDIVLTLGPLVNQFVRERGLGWAAVAPMDVILSDDVVVQPDILFVSNDRAAILTDANVRGAPDLTVEVLSPSTASMDRGDKMAVYGSHGVREYWIVDPDGETVEVYVAGDDGLTLAGRYRRGETLTSPLLEGLVLEVEGIFRG